MYFSKWYNIAMNKLKILFMGTPEFGATILYALATAPHLEVMGVVTQPDRPAGRKNQLSPPPVKVAAQELGLPLMQVERLRDSAVQAQLLEFSAGAEIFVVAAFGLILPIAVLNMPRLGCINVHGSLLPEYRGASPVAQAILDGKTETGITIMLMEKGLDTGPMLSKVVIPIEPEDTQPSLMDKLAKSGAALLLDTLPRWVAGQITPEKQDDTRATITGIIKKEYGLLDWNKPAASIECMTRAYYPWPGTYTFWQGQNLKITGATVFPEEVAESAIPGTVVLARVEGKERVLIATAKGWLAPRELQLPGKKAIPALEFVKGQRAIIGARLGDG